MLLLDVPDLCIYNITTCDERLFDLVGICPPMCLECLYNVSYNITDLYKIFLTTLVLAQLFYVHNVGAFMCSKHKLRDRNHNGRCIFLLLIKNE